MGVFVVDWAVAHPIGVDAENVTDRLDLPNAVQTVSGVNSHGNRRLGATSFCDAATPYIRTVVVLSCCSLHCLASFFHGAFFESLQFCIGSEN